MKRIACCLVFLLGLGQALAAQNVTASISGLVQDQSGGAVPAALVTATNTGTQAAFTAKTDEQGAYVFRSLPVGLYDVRAEAPGFQRAEAKGIRLQVNDALRQDFTLNVGSAAESITVTGAAVTVDTTTATLRTVVDQKRIEELPLNGRNPLQLMTLVAGVVPDRTDTGARQTTYPGALSVSVNGGRGNATNYVLDGAQHNDHYTNSPNPLPNPDALQEFSVQTNNFSAEFGRQSGGVVNAVTRSGTNQFHGAAYEYLRNNAVNAANFFAPIQNGVKANDGLKRNQFGVSAGGPVLIPKLYNGRDQTFFFFSYQGTRTRVTPSSISSVVPTASQRRGDFSRFPRALRNPFGGGNYPNNQIPASHFDPVVRQVMDNNLPVSPDETGRLTYFIPSGSNDNQYLVRGDHSIGSNHRLSGRYWHARAGALPFLNPSNYLALVAGDNWFNRSATLSDTHTVSPTLLNQMQFAYTRSKGGNTPITPAKSLTELGARLYSDPNPRYGFTVAGYFTMNTLNTNDFLRDEYQVSDTVRWTQGRHQMSFGGEYSRAISDIADNNLRSGVYTFNNSSPFTGDSMADFLIGRFQTFQQGVGETKENRFHQLGLFFQDSMKVARRLTLDLGVRWEPHFPNTDLGGRLASWRPGSRSSRFRGAPSGVVFPGDPGIPDGGYRTVWNNLGPRFGFAWDVFGNGRTSVRGAYGIFFDRSNAIATNRLENQTPFSYQVSLFGNINNSVTDPYAGTVNPFPRDGAPSPDTVFPEFSTHTVYEEHMRNPYVQSWNLTIERDIGGGFIGRASYAGSKGTRLLVLREGNAAVYSPGATTATTNQRRPFRPELGSLFLIEPVSNSTYHALQLTSERRFRRGFSILANYQFAKSLDDNSVSRGTGTNRTDPNSQAFDKGRSTFDLRHVFSFSGLWSLPGPASGPLKLLFGGWSLNSIVSLQSGFGLNAVSGVDNARSGTTGQRADLVGNMFLPEGRTRDEQILQWLNRAAFAPNALGTYGNIGRNNLPGPGTAITDAGIAKDFAVTERLVASFRFEAFNLFNRVNLGDPNTTQNAANFMRITGAGAPRILQFALRLRW